VVKEVEVILCVLLVRRSIAGVCIFGRANMISSYMYS